MKKQRGVASFFLMLLVMAMIALAAAMIWVTLLSPHFGQQLRVPISTVPCEVSGTSQQCYKAEDVLALNKALNMSDTISLLGVLLAVFAFIAPIFTYLTLQKEKQSLEATLKKKVDDSKDELEKYVVKTVNNLPNILYLIEAFKIRYQKDTPHGVTTAEREALDIALRLHSLLDRNANANEIFTHIAAYLTQAAISGSQPHIKMLKRVLRALYDAGYFADDERKRALNAFLESSLKTNAAAFFSDTAES